MSLSPEVGNAARYGPACFARVIVELDVGKRSNLEVFACRTLARRVLSILKINTAPRLS